MKRCTHCDEPINPDSLSVEQVLADAEDLCRCCFEVSDGPAFSNPRLALVDA